MQIRPFLDRLGRSQHDRMIAGVCSGFAEATESPIWIWRVAFLMACIGGGTGVILYLLLWYFMPLRGNS